MTEYIILRHTTEENLGVEGPWEQLTPTHKASSPRRALVAANVKAGEYVAIPARSWKPLTVKTEQTVKVTIS